MNYDNLEKKLESMPFRKIIKWGVIGAGSLMALFLLVLLSLEFFISDSYVASLVSRFSGNWLLQTLRLKKYISPPSLISHTWGLNWRMEK